MKFVKHFFIIFFLLVSIVLVIGIFMNKSYHIERSVTIDTPANEIFDYIKYLKDMDSYSYWSKIDPGMRRRYDGTDGTVGFVAYWSGNSEVGKGHQVITAIKDNTGIEYEIVYQEPRQSSVKSSMIVVPIDRETAKVTWSMDGIMNYPLNIMLPLLDMNRVLGEKLEAGLQNLKSIMDHKPDNPDITIPAVDSTELNE